jgi:hypothetical protein
MSQDQQYTWRQVSYVKTGFLKINNKFLNEQFLFWTLLPTHCRCRGLLLHLITLSATHTQTFGRVPLDNGSVCSRNIYPYLILTSHETQNYIPIGNRTRNPTITASYRLTPRGYHSQLITFPSRSKHSPFSCTVSPVTNTTIRQPAIHSCSNLQ